MELFNTNSLQGVVFILLALAIYFIPSIAGRKTSKAAPIFILNLFMGWTVIGWVAALIWAYNLPENKTAPAVKEAEEPEPDKFEKLRILKELYDNGTLTQDEFNMEKQKILN